MSLTHFDEQGRAHMVDVGAKANTAREAVAEGCVRMRPETLALIRAGQLAKGDVLAVAQVAGVMAAKRTPEIIPLCHMLLLTGVDLAFALEDGSEGGEEEERESIVRIQATVRTVGKTGAEMEALTAVSAAALTIYDMCKAVDRAMTLDDIRLVSKSGGKSGTFER
jgi:cyclic pyranopterin phosphate synthase